ncbi:hypothetical protein EDD18DRAFT_1110071 [Armillaria luteobubalina]|uniref:Uncharacterized protein n=1 Tax=Armillaria luteobubalina TaxID=153913 RepID=A0AA39PSG5_9AGAR|nr:hypothetical protein EDD18DRAFT_1110071 [Armillaria luteobubalina]
MALNSLINYLPNLGQPYTHPNFTEISLNSPVPSITGDTGEWGPGRETDYKALNGEEELVVEATLKNVEVHDNSQAPLRKSLTRNIQRFFTTVFRHTSITQLCGEIHFCPMRGDRFAIPPPLHMLGAGMSLPLCENPETASKIVVVPARERLGKLDLPFILSVANGAPLSLYGDIYCPAWYGNGVIVRVLLATKEYIVFNAEFDNDGYHHMPYQVTFVAHAKLFHLPLLRRGQQLMDQFMHRLWPGRKPKLEMVRMDIEEAMQRDLNRVTEDGYISSFPADVRPGTGPEAISKDQND